MVMDVKLFNYTPHAIETLIFTKETRLNMTADRFEEIKTWSEERKLAALEYMRNTIQSSWEFVEYYFLITGVSRAFTHQLVRHRHNSYAQQAQRVVDMTGFEYVTGPSIDSDLSKDMYDATMRAISHQYRNLLDTGVNPQDARGVLPTNICTNIIVKANLRSMHDMALKRLCVKAQGEAQDVFRAMREEVINVHPWAADFIRVWCAFYGGCAFPTFPMEDCPVKPLVYNPLTGRSYEGGDPAPLSYIHNVWETHRAEAQPKAPAK